MKKKYLQDGWFLQNEKTGTLSAEIPGCVHTDLQKHGIIENLFWRDNNKNYQWIERYDWTYVCKFDADTRNCVSIVFEGLDTYADIWLNNVWLGSADNMFIPHEYPVKGILQEKGNQLKVRFRSPVKEVEDKPELCAAFTCERLHTRRMQCTYGWDWVDRFVTCGIFRPVYLKYVQGIWLESLYVQTESIDRFSAQIYTEFSFSNCEEGKIAHVEIRSPAGKRVACTSFYADQSVMVRRFDIVNPELWFPNGYGDQPLYTIVVTIGDTCTEETFGIRTMKILQLPDLEGSPYWIKAAAVQKTEIGKIYSKNVVFSGFQVLINGVRILCKGGNWVPCEPFPSAETDEKIRKLVRQAAAMNANFLRVWGGGLPEKQAFYDECDRQGILVVQDFMMACGHYPEKESWFIDALQRESEFAVKYLRNHPCLSWWHGDNENAVEGSDTQKDYTGRDTALRGIAPTIYAYDRFRQFLPSSPFGGDTYASVTCGTTHNSNYCWNIFEYFHNSDCMDYKEFLNQFTARFISEEPTFGAVMLPSMLKFMTEEDLFNDEKEEIILYHTKNNPALDRHLFCDIRDFAQKVLGSFTDGHDRFFKYKYIQYEWVRVLFENCRRNLGYCNGLVFWMYNDCWPAALGWSFIDYYCLPKPAYYCFKRCAKHIVGTLDVDTGSYELKVSNDGCGRAEVTGAAYLICLTENCVVADSYYFNAKVEAYDVAAICLPWQTSSDMLVVCDLRYNAEMDRCFYKSGKLNIALIENALKIIEQDDFHIVVQAECYVHAVELEGNYIFEDNYFIMLPDEQRNITFEPVGAVPNGGVTLKSYTLC